jgi:hypothetical protein
LEPEYRGFSSQVGGVRGYSSYGEAFCLGGTFAQFLGDDFGVGYVPARGLPDRMIKIEHSVAGFVPRYVVNVVNGFLNLVCKVFKGGYAAYIVKIIVSNEQGAWSQSLGASFYRADRRARDWRGA